MNTRRAFLASPNGSIERWLKEEFDIVTIDNYESADIVVFPGGLDVNPALYGEPLGQRTSVNARTDELWVAHYKRAVKDRKKLLGICKGSQFLTAMSGAKLFQHVTNHALSDLHDIDISGKTYAVTSTHHQMMNPFVLSRDLYEILAFSTEKRSTTYLNGYDDECEPPVKEPEAVFYLGNGALAIQFHPEFMETGNPVNKEIEKWFEKMFKYELETIQDKYRKKTNIEKKVKRKVAAQALHEDVEIPEELVEQFINEFLQ